MTLFLVLTFAALEVEDDDLVCLELLHHGGCHGCAFDGRGADTDAIAFATGQDLVECGGIALSEFELFNVNLVANSYLVLMIAYAISRVS